VCEVEGLKHPNNVVNPILDNLPTLKKIGMLGIRSFSRFLAIHLLCVLLLAQRGFMFVWLLTSSKY
jgi:hypothetical protein